MCKCIVKYFDWSIFSFQNTTTKGHILDAAELRSAVLRLRRVRLALIDRQ